MKANRFHKDSGMILLQIIGVLMIITFLVGITLSVNPLQVRNQRQNRTRSEMDTVAAAVKRFAADVLKAQQYNPANTPPQLFNSTNYPSFPFPASIADLYTQPTAAAFVGVWQGPYLDARGGNLSSQYTMVNTFTSGKASGVKDPWGNNYSLSSTGPDGNSVAIAQLQIWLKCTGESTTVTTDDFYTFIDVTEPALKITKRRTDITNKVIESTNGTVCQYPNINTNWSAVLSFWNSSSLLPSDRHYNCDALGFEFSILLDATTTDCAPGDPRYPPQFLDINANPQDTLQVNASSPLKPFL